METAVTWGPHCEFSPLTWNFQHGVGYVSTLPVSPWRCASVLITRTSLFQQLIFIPCLSLKTMILSFQLWTFFFMFPTSWNPKSTRNIPKISSPPILFSAQSIALIILQNLIVVVLATVNGIQAVMNTRITFPATLTIEFHILGDNTVVKRRHCYFRHMQLQNMKIFLPSRNRIKVYLDAEQSIYNLK